MCSTHTSASTHRSTQRHKPEDQYRHLRHRENPYLTNSTWFLGQGGREKESLHCSSVAAYVGRFLAKAGTFHPEPIQSTSHSRNLFS